MSPARKPRGWLAPLGIVFGLFIVGGMIHDKLYPETAKKMQEQADDVCKSTTKQKNAARKFIESFGYDCSVVNLMCSASYFVKDAIVHCNNGLYTFNLENHGGVWSVKTD
jgi:hypothetical protein